VKLIIVQDCELEAFVFFFHIISIQIKVDLELAFLVIEDPRNLINKTPE
jgi:hypothetical protein